MPSLLGVATAAWERAKPGVNPNFMGYRVVRLPKMVLVTPRVLNLSAMFGQKDRVKHLVVVAFPHPDHAEHFFKSRFGVRGQGPAEDNPGAIGTIGFEANTYAGPVVELAHAQAHFKTSGDHALPRRLATRYGGWRIHAFREIAQLAKQLGFQLWISKALLAQRGLLRQPSHFSREVNQTCGELGFELEQRANGIMLHPPQRVGQRRSRA